MTATYDSSGQLATCTGCGTIGYDDAGRTTALAGWTYRVSTADPRRAIGLAVPPACALAATDYVTTSTFDALGNERTTTDPTTPPSRPSVHAGDAALHLHPCTTSLAAPASTQTRRVS